MIRRLLVLVALVAGLVVLPSATPAQAAERDPILFVHGFSGNSSNWWVMKGWFERDGWTQVYNWQYNSFQSNVTTAGQIRDKVNQIKRETGASKVDLVTHSMGGLSSRYYLKNLGGTAHVDDWVSIGGPNNGTSWAWGCFTSSCVQMRANSSFLNALNSGDPTPGGVNYGTFWSPCDEIIIPQRSVILTGATNTRTGCIGHISLLGAWSVYTGVRDFVRW
jgi:triacylglycerol lipase